MKSYNEGAINVENGLQKAVICSLLSSWEDISLSSSEDVACSFWHYHSRGWKSEDRIYHIYTKDNSGKAASFLEKGIRIKKRCTVF